jgi:hypothetical protein
MEMNKNYLIAGLSFLLIFLFILLKISGILFLLPRPLDVIISGIFPVIILGLLLVVIIALVTNKSAGAAERTICAGVIGFLVIIEIIYAPVLVFELFFHNQDSAINEYHVSVTGFEEMNEDLIDEVRVPIPVQNGEPLFPAGKMDGLALGGWHTNISKLPGSNDWILVFRHEGEGPVDIDAKFYEYRSEGLIVDDNNKVFLSPAFDGQDVLKMKGRFAWSSGDSPCPYDYSYRSTVSFRENSTFIPETGNDEVYINILLRTYTGRTGFMTDAALYSFKIDEPVKLNGTGFYPVNVSVHIS